MFFTSFIVVLALQGLSAYAQKPGTAVFANRCPYDIWVQHINGERVDKMVKLKARTKYSRPLEISSCEGCGTVFKASKTPQIVNGKHTQFEYAIEPAQNMIYYDISYVNCAQGKSAANCPGHERGHAITSPQKACGRAQCRGGAYCPTQSYYVPQPLLDPAIGLAEPVFGCGNKGYGNELRFIMCSDEPSISKRGIAGRIELDDEDEE